MQKKNKGALNLAGLVLFLLALPFFFGMGGGAFAMAEVLPGQAAASFLPYTEKTESLSAKVFGTKDVEFSQTPRHFSKWRCQKNNGIIGLKAEIIGQKPIQ